ncbi:hypothetical protein CL628_03720 [bacterium]|nr:hypothetical protein [bacterium]
MHGSDHDTQELLEGVALEVLPPAQAVDYNDFVDQVRDEVGRHFDSGANRQLIIDLFRDELEKEYFGQRVARIVRREQKVLRANRVDRLLWLVIGGAIAAIATHFIGSP